MPATDLAESIRRSRWSAHPALCTLQAGWRCPWRRAASSSSCPPQARNRHDQAGYGPPGERAQRPADNTGRGRGDGGREAAGDTGRQRRHGQAHRRARCSPPRARSSTQRSAPDRGLRHQGRAHLEAFHEGLGTSRVFVNSRTEESARSLAEHAENLGMEARVVGEPARRSVRRASWSRPLQAVSRCSRMAYPTAPS